MDLKKIIGFLCFLVLGFMSKATAQLNNDYQSLLIVNKDTLIMWETFLPDPYLKLKITSDKEEMSHVECNVSGSYFATWKIEHDSLFLISLEEVNDRKIDLNKAFNERCVDGRVFGKEINYEIEAQRYMNAYNLELAFKNNKRDENNNLLIDSFYRANTFITIKNGKLIEQTAFGFDSDEKFIMEGFRARKDTDWKNFPAVDTNTMVVLKIILDEKGELVNASIARTLTQDLVKVKLDQIWQQEILRQIRLVKWKLYYRVGKMIHKQRYAYFLFKR